MMNEVMGELLAKNTAKLISVDSSEVLEWFLGRRIGF